jgi:hypothetical protein
LRNVMVASSPPPPMDTGAAVEAGRRAHRRRRTTRAGVVAGLAVVGIAVGATLLPRAMSGGLVDTAAGPSEAAPPPMSSAAPVDTSTSWPSGQVDRTAGSGPRAVKSADIVPALAAALPPGLVVAPAGSGLDVRTQSEFENYTKVGLEVWQYRAVVPVLATDGTQRVGTLLAEIETTGNGFPSGPCEVGARAPEIRGTCRVVDVDGKQVGLVTSDGSDPAAEFEQAAAYRYEDGTVVFVAQAKAYDNGTSLALAAVPLTEAQLAKLATDPKFHLS